MRIEVGGRRIERVNSKPGGTVTADGRLKVERDRCLSEHSLARYHILST